MRLPKWLWRLLRSKRFHRFLIIAPFAAIIGAVSFYAIVNHLGRTRLIEVRNAIHERGSPIRPDDLLRDNPLPEQDMLSHTIFEGWENRLPYSTSNASPHGILSGQHGIPEKTIFSLSQGDLKSGTGFAFLPQNEAAHLMSLLDAHDATPRAIGEALRRPDHSVAADSTLGIIGLPYEALRVYDFFQVHARLALLADQPDAARRDLEALHTVSVAARKRPSNLMSGVLAIGVNAAVYQSFWNAASMPSCNEALLRLMDEWLVEMADPGFITTAYEGHLVERSVQHDIWHGSSTALPLERMQWSVGDIDDLGSAVHTFRSWIWQLQPRGFLDLQEAEALRRLERRILFRDTDGAARHFSREEIERFHRLDNNAPSIPNTSNYLNKRIDDEIWSTCYLITRKATSVAATGRLCRVAIACERHRRDHGDFPETVSALAPRYLPESPVSPFDQSPINLSTAPDGTLTLICAGLDPASPITCQYPLKR